MEPFWNVHLSCFLPVYWPVSNRCVLVVRAIALLTPNLHFSAGGSAIPQLQVLKMVERRATLRSGNSLTSLHTSDTLRCRLPLMCTLGALFCSKWRLHQ